MAERSTLSLVPRAPVSRHFPHWIKTYVEHSVNTEAPTIFHLWSAVSAISGALRRQVWIDEVKYQYYPNFYIILVGPAAITKTTAMNQAKKLLRQVPDVHFGPASATWQSFIKGLGEASQDIVFDLPDGRTKGVTTCPVTIMAEELGTFFKVDDHVLMDVLTSLWDNPEGPWTHSTLTMGNNTVESPCVNFIGCTTPSWLKKHFPEDLIGGGLTSRIVFIYGDKKQKLIAYPSRHIVPSHHRITEEKLVEDLTRISQLKGQVTLTERAYVWGEAWYAKAEKTRPLHLASERYSSYLGRKQTHIHKLAIILSAAKRDDLVIDQEDLEEALALIEMVEPHMLKVFESIGLVDEARRTEELVQLVRIHKVLTFDQLWGLVRNIMTQFDFTSSLKAAVQAEQLKAVSHQNKKAVMLHPSQLAKEKASEPK